MHIFILDKEIIRRQEAVTRTPDSPRRDFRKEAVAEPQEEQPIQEEVKPDPQEEQLQLRMKKK